MYGGAVGELESTTCPICGKGTLRTVDFGDQQPESRQVQTFTCGHEVEGGRPQTADADGLDVERRQSVENDLDHVVDARPLVEEARSPGSRASALSPMHATRAVG
jgi:hypothetical protein